MWHIAGSKIKIVELHFILSACNQIRKSFTNTIMPRWPLQPCREENIQSAIIAWNSRLYKDRETCAKAHGVDPQTLRRRLDGKQQPHKVAHTNQNRITVAGEDAIVQHLIYLANAGFPCRQHTVRSIATVVLRREYANLPRYVHIDPLGIKWVYNFLKRQDELRCCYVRSINQERALVNNNPGLI